MTRRWTLRLAGGLAAGMALLSGCSDERPASATLPSADAGTTSSAAEPPPLGPADLPMPAEARTQDAAGAEAFVRYYIDLINRTSTVMDAAPLREFSQGCTECDRLATNTEADAASGHAYNGGQIRVAEAGEPLIRADTAQVAFRVDQAAFQVLDASGSPTDGGSPPYENISAGMALMWNGEMKSWLMTELTFG